MARGKWTEWKTGEEKYLIENYTRRGPKHVAAHLNRLVKSVMGRAQKLRREGRMPKVLPGTLHYGKGSMTKRKTK